jgi:ABC-type transport system involved in Fe-S cluster assembly fused permease/ATPase subunit
VSLAFGVSVVWPCATARSSRAEQIQDAAKLAGIHDEILRMPMGWEALVGEMGSSSTTDMADRVVPVSREGAEVWHLAAR